MQRDQESSAPCEVDLFDHLPTAQSTHLLQPWPAQDRFPLNVDARRVDQAIRGDLRGSASPLIVTGYAALDLLIDFLSELSEHANAQVLLGQEPFASKRETFEMAGHDFPREVQEYWLEQGIST